MKTVFLSISMCVIVVTSCASKKTVISEAALNEFNNMIANKQFYIESNWAYPQTTMALQQVLNSGLMQPGSNAGSISLIGNTNFLKVSGDSISSNLPYFGERQMQVAYGGTDSAIEFKGVTKNYKTEKNKDNSYTISFEAISNSEIFNVYIRLSPQLKSDISLNSASRFPIRYSGDVTSVKPKE